MLITIDPSHGIPIFRQIVDQVRAAVAAGTPRPGEMLPSIRHLAVELRVNPNTVAKAFRELESEGIVESRQGLGTVVISRSVRLVAEERCRILRESLGHLIARAQTMGVSGEELDRLYEEVKAMFGLDSAAVAGGKGRKQHER